MKFPAITLLLTLIAIGVSSLAGFAPEAWVFDRQGIAQGEWWRLVSGHFAHSDLAHAQWDIIAFAVVGSLLEQWSRGAVVIACAGGVLFIDVWLWWGMSSLDYYCGLSGIVNSLLGLLLINLWREKASPLLILVTFAVVGKILIEIITGLALFTDTAWPSVPSVHLVGLVFAGLVGVIHKHAQVGKDALHDRSEIW